MRIMLLNVLVLSLVACPRARPQKPVYADALIKGVPHVRQKPDFCGEACAEMYLRARGLAVTQDRVFDLSGLDPLTGRGCHTAELAVALKKLGFAVGPVWGKVAARAGREFEAAWKALHDDLLAGTPSIVCMRYDQRPKTTEHFRLVTGYAAKTDEVIYHEPAEANGAYRRMARSRFLALWPLQYDQREWTLIRLALAVPGKLAAPAAPRRGRFSEADYAQHILALKRKLPHDGFTIVLERPFVVIGDEPAPTVRRRAASTVRWAATLLKKAYFSNDPLRILDVWLFKDKQSYVSHVKKLWNDVPGTPFGYYSAAHGALVMNISTGGGTLVHEIVHPFIEANFPGCPSWFNEGLASLYEQCGERGGKIHGYTNWRLAGLQKAIRAGELSSFQTLTGTTSNQFYSDDRGSNYGQARYLCYYLQQQGKLRKFYRAFVAGRAKDPSGYRTLQQVLGVKDMAAFQREWERWVLKLEYR